jgi:hypothetical protein
MEAAVKFYSRRMKSLKSKSREAANRPELERIALELAVACPVDSSNPHNCPLHELRKRAMPERVSWVRSLPFNDLIYLVSYHQVCLGARLDREILHASWECKSTRRTE